MTIDADDLALFFDTADGAAENASYTVYGGTAATIPVKFASAPSDSGVGGALYGNRVLTARCRTSDVPNASNLDTITIRSVTYKVIDVDVDVANGESLLILSKG